MNQKAAMYLTFQNIYTVPGKNPPGKKLPRIGLGLGSGGFFPCGFFPRTIYMTFIEVNTSLSF